MPYKSICVIGSSNVDLLINSNDELEFDISMKGHIKIYPGGVARNIAVGLASFYQKLTFLTVLSSDFLGEIIVSSLKREYINYEESIILDNSSFYCQVSSPNGNIAINDIGNIGAIDRNYLSNHLNLFDKSQLLIFDLNISIDCIGFLTSYCFPKGVKLFCDATSAIKCLKIRSFLQYIYMIKLNYCEATKLVGFTHTEKPSEYILIKKVQELGVRNVCITLGKNGAILACDNSIWKVSRNDFLNISDTVGAGDAFFAALIYKFITTNDWLKSLVFANNIGFYYLKRGEHNITQKVILCAEKDDSSSVSLYKWVINEQQWRVISLEN